MIGKSLGTLVAKILVVAVAGGIVMGGLVAAGALSGTVQTGASVGAAGVTGTVHTQAEERSSASVAATAKAEADEKEPDVKATASPQAKESPSAKEAEEKGNDNAQGDENNQGEAAGDAGVNHGHCVSFAAHAVEKLNLTGEQRGDFISLVARDESAVSAKVAEGGKPGAACQAAIVKAAKAAMSASASVTGTAHDTENHGAMESDLKQGHGRGGHG